MRRTLKGISLAGSTGLLWGLTTLASKLMGAAGVAISLAVFFRMVVVVGVQGAWSLWRHPQELRVPAAALSRTLLFSFFAPFGVYLGFMMSVVYLDAAQALVLHYTFPMITALCSPLFTGERPSHWDFAGAALVTVGVACAAMTPEWTFNTHLDVRGVLWGVAAIIGLVGQTLMVRNIARDGEMTGSAYQVYSHLGGAVWICAYITAAGEWGEFARLTPYVALLIFVPTLLSCLWGYKLYHASLKYVPASVSSLMASMEILSGVALTALFGGQNPTGPELAGCACIFGAIALVSVSQLRCAPRKSFLSRSEANRCERSYR